MSNVNWVTLIVALLGAVKLILQPFGIEITEQHINDIANGAAALVTVWGVVYSHVKQTTGGDTSAQSNNTAGYNK